MQLETGFCLLPHIFLDITVVYLWHGYCVLLNESDYLLIEKHLYCCHSDLPSFQILATIKLKVVMLNCFFVRMINNLIRY